MPTILLKQHGDTFDARIAGMGNALHTPEIKDANSEEEAIGRLILLLSHPLKFKIVREETKTHDD